MSCVLEHFRKFWQWLQSAHTISHAAIKIPSENVMGEGARPTIRPGASYIQVRINELFLQYMREWHKKYDPMVLVVTELVYGYEEVAVPFIVGPKLLEKYDKSTPDGMLFHNTRVAGPYPYRGGRVALTVILYKIEKKDYVLGLLRAVERFSEIVPYWAELSNYLKVGERVLDTVEEMLGFGDTTPIVGHRFEIDPDAGDNLRPAYFALLDKAEIDANRLWVKNSRLYEGPSSKEAKSLDNSDFTLYSITANDTRSDERTLPFYPLVEDAQAAALASTEDSWVRAKVLLATLNQKLLLSPDLTRQQAQALFKVYRDWVVQAHEGRLSLEKLSKGAQSDVQKPPLDSALHQELDARVMDILNL